jgi:anaerobic selenocysteine-containing dehydrogenase
MSETAELSDFVLPMASPLETLVLAEPLPLGKAFLSAALPAVEPPSSCLSFDDWLMLMATAILGSAPESDPSRFAVEKVDLAADKAVYALPSASPPPLEANMPSIAASLKTLISEMSNLPEPRPEQSFLTVFEESVQGPASAPSKWLNEITYSPKLYLHPRRAARLGIKGGDPVTLTDSRGASADGIAMLFEGVHPDALAIPLHHGHTGYGRVARGERFDDPKDPDMSRVFWGESRGVNVAGLDGLMVTVRKRGV